MPAAVIPAGHRSTSLEAARAERVPAESVSSDATARRKPRSGVNARARVAAVSRRALRAQAAGNPQAIVTAILRVENIRDQKRCVFLSSLAFTQMYKS